MHAMIPVGLSAVLLCAGGCLPTIVAAPTIMGSGITKEESRELAPFTSVEVTAAFEVAITIGPKQAVTLGVDDNLLPIVETVVQDGRLVVRFATNTSITTTTPQKITIVVPKLDAIVASGATTVNAMVEATATMTLEASGASSITVNGLAADVVDVKASGAAKVHLDGKGKRLTLHATGASKVFAPDIPFESATVDLSGTSRGELKATGSIDGSLSGASVLTVQGNPAKRSVQTSGAAGVTY